MKQLIFRLEKDAPYEITDMEGYRFAFIGGVQSFCKETAIILRHEGMLNALRVLLKVLNGKRKYCMVIDSCECITSHAWLSLGFCRHYKVDPSAVVIGPVWTGEVYRGKGLASWLLCNSINNMLRYNLKMFYVDTASDNTAMLKVIEKLGFDSKILEFDRPVDGFR